ncbi:unknown [Candidatus Colimorpha enterica]|uniref:Uncharacterized protein n=1 Tax=Candidatus Colimorpha enterica TaxID=3083063 RepID=R6U0N6_9BACT|nr:unknown [Candidatus Colimorpha enterica]
MEELYFTLLWIAVAIALIICLFRYLIVVPTELKKIRLILQDGRDIPKDPAKKFDYVE